jgi:hypothetical protein
MNNDETEFAKYNNFYEPSFADHIINITELKNTIKINNLNVDFNVNKIKINIMIAIYLYNIDSCRYSLTELIFKHYNNIQKYFEQYVIITFTIIGSEKDLSKNLVLKYFNEQSYYEFDQNGYGDFYTMLYNKINLGMKISYHKDADILLWAGSNDYICFNFFKQLIEFYNPNELQIYGISNYFNGNNAVYYCKYIDHNIIDEPFFWHNGKFNYCNREIYEYIGGIVGISKKVFDIYPDLLEKWGLDEGENERLVLEKNNYEHLEEHKIHMFNTKNLFFINIKLDNSEEINTYSILLELLNNDTINNNGKYLNDKFLKIFQDEYVYIKQLKNM